MKLSPLACKQGSSAGSGERELRLSVSSHGRCRDLAPSSVCPDFWNRRSPPPKPGPELLKSPGSSADCGSVGGAPPRGSALSVRHHRCQPGRGREVHVPPEVSSPEFFQSWNWGGRVRLYAAPARVNPVTVSSVNVLRSAANFHLKPLKSSKLPSDDLSCEEPAAQELCHDWICLFKRA